MKREERVTRAKRRRGERILRERIEMKQREGGKKEVRKRCSKAVKGGGGWKRGKPE